MEFAISISTMSERKEIIRQRVENATKKSSIHDFRGEAEYQLPVIKVDVSLPIYRMGNCRAFSAQQSVIAKNGLDKDYFVKGQEKSSVQEEQHNILARLAKKGKSNVVPIYEELERVGQREPLLITSSGMVVNGNRRLAAMRELYKKNDGSVDRRFEYVECSVLPADTTADEIDDIEADLQARPETKLDYDWIGDAQLIRRQVNKGRSPKEVGDRLRRSESEIKNVLQALDEADLYLSEWVQKPGQYDLVSADGEQLFGDIPKKIKNKSSELQNASRAIAWSLFENREQISGRVYAYNASFGKLAPMVLDQLAKELDLDEEDIEEAAQEEDFFVEIDEGDPSDTDYLPLIDALKREETKEDTFSSLIDACQTAIEHEKGKKSEKAALKALSQANAKLTGIDVLTAGEATLSGIEKQIESIRNVLDNIEEVLRKRLDAMP